MKFTIPIELIKVVGLWLAIGTIVTALTWLRLLLRLRKLGDAEPLWPGAPPELTKEMFLHTLRHMAFDHNAVWAILLGMAFVLLRDVLLWPRTLYRLIHRKPPDDDDSNDVEPDTDERSLDERKAVAA